MGMMFAMLTMLVIFVVVFLLAARDPRAAYEVLAHSQHLFDADAGGGTEKTVARPQSQATKRPYLSPFTKKKVAARQKWRCAICNRLLDETYEIDHIKPLYAGGDNTMPNLRALHRSCHVAHHANARMTVRP